MKLWNWLKDFQYEVFPTPQQKENQFYQSGIQMARNLRNSGFSDEDIFSQSYRCTGGRYAEALGRGMRNGVGSV